MYFPSGISRHDMYCLDNSNPADKAVAKEKILYALLQKALDRADNYLEKACTAVCMSFEARSSQ
jgi:hypothetical protein